MWSVNGRAGAAMRGAWASPALMTLFNTVARILAVVGVLPFVLSRFTPGDVSLFYLFHSVISLQMLAGGGFVPTFARFIAHSLAVVSTPGEGDSGTGRVSSDCSDGRQLAALVGTLRRIFLVLSLLSFPVMAGCGSLLLITPVAASSSELDSWAAWAIVAAVTPLSLYASQYSAVLQGASRVAEEQRWAGVYCLAATLISICVLSVGGGLLALVAVNQVFQLVTFVRLYRMTSSTLRSLPYRSEEDRYSSSAFRMVWPNAWRSFLGVAIYSGIVSGSGLIFAQVTPSNLMAEFLLGLRIIAAVSEVSRAPFYSLIPHFNRLRACGKIEALQAAAQQSMLQSHLGFLALFGAAPVLCLYLLPLIRSNVAFPSMLFWSLLGISVYVERWGAMHLQIYSTTSDIIWHWLNGFTGVLWLILILVLTPVIGLYSYPVGMLVANSLIYTPISVQRSLKSMGCSWWAFERHCVVPANVCFCFCIVCLWIVQPWNL